MSKSDLEKRDAELSPAMLLQVKTLCDEYRATLAVNGTGTFAPILLRVEPAARTRLLKELCQLAVEHLRSNGIAEIAGVLLAANPALHGELQLILPELESVALTEMFISRPTNGPAAPPIPRRKPSRGLHIRCPHCSNPVELVADTPFDVISCQTCGSNFNLIDRSEGTRTATALEKIGRFELISRLGVGGFGTVWKARDTELDRIVAVKIPRRGQLSGQETEQFFREARAVAQLRHTNIVPVHEVGRDDDSIFIVSDLIRGVALSDWLTAGKPSFLETADLIATIADALEHAHQNGIVHRDLKPSNVMIDDHGVPHLMDFGLAKRDVEEIAMTADGQIVGTPAYMSPEQAAGKSQWVDRRTDLYSLGVMLFEMLTGELPFRGNAQMQVHQRLHEDAPNVRTLNRYIPRDMATICAKCLERDPAGRYGTAKEVADELRRHLNNVPINARPLSRPERLFRWTKRNPLLATVIVLILFLAVVGPSAAIVIAGQHNRLKASVQEKFNMISKGQLKENADATELSRVSKELAIEQGRVSPWQVFPEARTTRPRHLLLRSLFKHSRKTLSDAIDDPSNSKQSRVRALLALATMIGYDGANNAESAKLRFEAIKLLKQLRDEHPEDYMINKTLAQTIEDYTQIAGPEASQVDTYLDEAATIREQIAQAQPDKIEQQIAWFDSIIRCAYASAPDARKRRLENGREIVGNLESQWPKDIASIYQLACYLAESACPLVETTMESGPAVSPKVTESSD